MSSIFIDHKIIRPYYNQRDVIITNVYNDKMSPHDAISIQYDHKEYIILLIDHCDLIINFNIKSKNASTAYVCIFGFIVSLFHILKGQHDYHHLILRCGNAITLILEKSCITDVNVQSISKLKCEYIKCYESNNDEYAHRIIKVNDFSPSVVYHNSRLCEHSVSCSFDNPRIIYYVDNGYNLNIIDPVINVAKINGVSKKIIQLLNMNNCMIKDVVLYLAVIMYHIV